MLNILFYTSFNTRSRDTESLMQAFVNQGHAVFVLTQAEKGAYHEACEQLGVRSFAYSINKQNSLVYFFKHALFLKRFCTAHSIHLVYAHLENAGLAAVLCRPFISAKVFTCRHTVDEAELMGSRKFMFLNKIVYTLSRNSIVVSQRSKNHMVEKEGISEKKVRVIRLAYNFDLYPKADPRKVEEIRQAYSASLLMLCACRMMEGKRPQLAIKVCKKMLDEGLDVKLILLGDGPLLTVLKKQVFDLNLESKVFILGYRSNIMDFLSAADILIHPSVQDSSSVIIKEAGLNAKAVITCKDVGDAMEYLIHGQNALLVSSSNAEKEFFAELKAIYKDPNKLERLGQALKNSVLQRFSISTILPEYNRIHLELEQHGTN
jgi:glycosyltransferase involved in cell wall biosynthesis